MLELAVACPDLEVLRLFGRTGPHKFVDQTFWKVILSGYFLALRSITIQEQDTTSKQISKSTTRRTYFLLTYFSSGLWRHGEESPTFVSDRAPTVLTPALSGGALCIIWDLKTRCVVLGLEHIKYYIHMLPVSRGWKREACSGFRINGYFKELKIRPDFRYEWIYQAEFSNINK